MITTPHLNLVPLTNTFSQEIINLWGDYEVIKYTNSTLLKSPEECHNKLSEWLPMYNDNDGPNKFAILLEGNMIGIIGYPVLDNDNFKCGFFYQLMKAYWGKGYGYEAAKAMISYLYQLHTNASIIADAVDDNLASIKILNKLGFTQVGIEQKGFKKNGMERDIYHFEMNHTLFELMNGNEISNNLN